MRKLWKRYTNWMLIRELHQQRKWAAERREIAAYQERTDEIYAARLAKIALREGYFTASK